MSVQINIRACYDCSRRMQGSFPSAEETLVSECNICKESRYTNPYILNFETVEPDNKQDRYPGEYTDGVQRLYDTNKQVEE